MRVGVGADHGGFEMKQQLVKLLRDEDHEVIDFGNNAHDTNDDYPDFVPLDQAAAVGDVERGVLVCGSGVSPWLQTKSWASALRSAAITFRLVRVSRRSARSKLTARQGTMFNPGAFYFSIISYSVERSTSASS
jgi:RpiB/LacA/LacB family sugar-phosphate isomerase